MDRAMRTKLTREPETDCARDCRKRPTDCKHLLHHRDKGTFDAGISRVSQAILTSCILTYPCKLNCGRIFSCTVCCAPLVEREKSNALMNY
jgi:hypothetical protein